MADGHVKTKFRRPYTYKQAAASKAVKGALHSIPQYNKNANPKIKKYLKNGGIFLKMGAILPGDILHGCVGAVFASRLDNQHGGVCNPMSSCRLFGKMIHGCVYELDVARRTTVDRKRRIVLQYLVKGLEDGDTKRTPKGLQERDFGERTGCCADRFASWQR